MTAGSATRNGLPIMVGAIPSSSLGPDLQWAHKDQMVSRAETMMLLHRYSQVPVFDHGQRPLRNKLKGMATWESIARARLISAEPKLADALAETPPQVVHKDSDLFRAIPMILDAEAVLVAEQGDICGIVTAYDLTEWLADRSEPFFALSETEELLRSLFAQITEIDTLLRSVGPDDAPVQIDDLTMGECIRVLDREETWQQIGADHDRATVVAALNEARETRNRLMHGHGHCAGDTQQCRNLLDYLRVIVKSQRQGDAARAE